jgi:predicted outer membrane repeat protein
MIAENWGGSYGGGVECFSASPTFVNCIITGNSAHVGGGVEGFGDCAAEFLNCTISGNSGGIEGINCSSVSVTVVNCIISALRDEAVWFSNSAGSSFERCCIVRQGGDALGFNHPSDGPPGIGRLVTTNANGDSCDIYGNIYLGPFFVDPIAGDFHLGDWSPCIGAGQAGGPDEDIEGHPRPNPPGSLPDIGAYENTLAAPVPYQGLSGSLSGVLGPGIYRVGGSISVNSGATLRILPGTTFLFGGPFSFEIRGTLLAEGTQNDSILFTTDGPLPEPWRGLRFSGSGGLGTFSYCVFEYGYAAGGDSGDHGGAVYCDRASLSFNHCSFRYNTATALGGAIHCESASIPFLNCTFQANSADIGGAVYCDDSSPTFTDCSFLGNTVWSVNSDGGGVACYASSPVFTGCLLDGNYSRSDGGGVYCCERSSPTFTNCTLTDNHADGYGGAIYCRIYSSPSFSSCIISGNSANIGGGLYCFGYSSPTLTLCTVNGNSADWGGALYCWVSSSPTFAHSTLSRNSGYDGGGVYCEGSSPAFTNCTINNNTVSNNGGAVYCLNSQPTFNTTTIAFSQGEGIYFRGGGAGSRIYHCDFFGNSNGNFVFHNGDSSQGPPNIGQLDTMNANGDSCDSYHNIFLDPEFLSADDFHLQANSPCIDAGDPSLPLDPDTTIADIGAFYFDQSAVEPSAILLPTTFALHPNWPNPFNSSTMIRYDVPRTGEVRLTIFNLLGQRVATLLDQRRLAGTYTVTWDASNLPSGLYFCRMEAAGFAQTRKMLLVK